MKVQICFSGTSLIKNMLSLSTVIFSVSAKINYFGSTTPECCFPLYQQQERAVKVFPKLIEQQFQMIFYFSKQPKPLITDDH